jgi:hypothetical protein
MLIQSPAAKRCPFARIVLAAASISAARPTTHTLPICRPTSAAWLVIPPRGRIPAEACIPRMSSGDVRAHEEDVPAAARGLARAPR